MFVEKLFDCAKEICLEDNKTITSAIRELNAFAIVYDSANKKARDQKQEEQEKKERQINIETNLNLRPSPPLFSTPEDTAGLDIASSVNEKRISSTTDANVDNQFVTPPNAEEVVEIEMAKENSEEVKTGRKRKNSSLVEGGDSTKPSSVKNQMKFRSNEMINMIDGMVPHVNKSIKDLMDIMNEKYDGEDRKKTDKATYLTTLYKIRQDKSAIGEDLTTISKMIEKTTAELEAMK